MRNRNVRPATRADWIDLAKVVGLMDLALLLALMVCLITGGRA